MEDYKKYKQIFSLRLAGYLMFNGFRIKRIHHNLKEKDKDIYLFDDTPELEIVMLEYNELKRIKDSNKYGNNKQGSGSKNKSTKC